MADTVNRLPSVEKAASFTDDLMSTMAKAVFDSVMEHVEKNILPTVLKRLDEGMREKMIGLVREEMTSFAKSLPAAQVVVPEGAFRIEMPPPRTVRKNIEYSANGFPIQIVETEVKE